VINKSLFSSNSDEWSTPDSFFRFYNRKYKFTLDVCATAENTKCDDYYTKEQDGLKQSWTTTPGWVWCNPPYSKIKDWVIKASDEQSRGVKIVMLIPARTDTKWFHEYIYNMKNIDIEFIKGRLKFSNSKNSAPFPSMLVIFS
jgi:phage N-6-adenine-methyltransferase